MRYALLAVLATLAMAAPAQAQDPPIPEDREPVAVESEVIDDTGVVDEPDEVRTETDSRGVPRLIRYKVKSRALTFSCWTKNKVGQKLYQQNVRWHWSWYVKPLMDTIKDAWHEPVSITSVNWLWSYEGSFYAGSMETLANASGLKIGKHRPVTSHFKMDLPWVGVNRYLTGDHYLLVMGDYRVRCSS